MRGLSLFSLGFGLAGVLMGSSVFAQGQPRLKCAVRYQNQVIPMYWFGGDSAHHLNGPDSFGVIVKEKSTDDKVEVNVMEAAEDEVWDKLVELTDKGEISPELRQKLRNLGRTRMTTAYVGLYNDVLHFEHRLGVDRNSFEISCAKQVMPGQNKSTAPVPRVEPPKARGFDI